MCVCLCCVGGSDGWLGCMVGVSLGVEEVGGEGRFLRLSISQSSHTANLFIATDLGHGMCSCDDPNSSSSTTLSTAISEKLFECKIHRWRCSHTRAAEFQTATSCALLFIQSSACFKLLAVWRRDSAGFESYLGGAHTQE